MFASKDTLLTRPSGGYTIARSVRLRSSATAYFNRTFTTPTNNTTWTWSAWIKRGALDNVMLWAGASGNLSGIGITSNQIIFYGSAGSGVATSTAVFRDPSAWYHMVFVSNGTTIVAYVNNVQVLSYTGTLTQLNASGGQLIFCYRGTSSFFDGYATEINFIDGQALTPSSFGETDSITGVWKAKKYGGTYGTNGFYLNFSDNSNNTAATIGKDYSGNGNNWTPNNISVTSGVTYDSMVDSPTVGATSSNYATLNPLAVGSSGTLSDGSLKIAGVNSANVGASYSTIGMTTGKWYFEVTAVGVGSNFSYALVEDVVDTSALNVSGAIFAGYRSTGDTYGTVSITTTTWNSVGVVIGVAVDCDNGAIYFANANTWINSGVPTSGASRTGAITTYTAGTKTLHGGVGCFQDSTQSAAINFGQRPFSYTPPTGFVALNTYNLPASTITNGAGYMNIALQTGTGAAADIPMSNGMAPDFIWLKSRSTGSTNNVTTNRLVPNGNTLFTNTTGAEITNPELYFSGNNAGMQPYSSDAGQNGQTYVLWGWKAGGGTGVTNTSGSITSTVSAGATQGFSVVTYTGTGANATVGHGLGVAPSMIIVKSRSQATSWPVYHASLTAAGRVFLDLTNGYGASSEWNSTAPTSTVFSIGPTGYSVNNSGITYVAYCFSAVAGYSAFGSFTGNGSSDGPFVYLGFRPRFILMKNASNSVQGWTIQDTSRSASNVANLYLVPCFSDAEATTYAQTDFLSNGFKTRTSDALVNGSGNTIIYMAFAENPFRNALAR